jgi:hypothetical protein
LQCLTGDFIATQNLISNKNIIRDYTVKTQTEFMNFFDQDKIQTGDYNDYYFIFPNYSSKYFTCQYQEYYIKLTEEPRNWENTYSNYYIKKDGQYIQNTQTSYQLADKYLLEGENTDSGPNDFNSNFMYYYKKDKNGNFVVLTEPEAWQVNTFYIESAYPDYTDNVYYLMTVKIVGQEV